MIKKTNYTTAVPRTTAHPHNVSMCTFKKNAPVMPPKKRGVPSFGKRLSRYSLPHMASPPVPRAALPGGQPFTLFHKDGFATQVSFNHINLTKRIKGECNLLSRWHTLPPEACVFKPTLTIEGIRVNAAGDPAGDQPFANFYKRSLPNRL